MMKRLNLEREIKRLEMEREKIIKQKSQSRTGVFTQMKNIATPKEQVKNSPKEQQQYRERLDTINRSARPDRDRPSREISARDRSDRSRPARDRPDRERPDLDRGRDR